MKVIEKCIELDWVVIKDECYLVEKGWGMDNRLEFIEVIGKIKLFYVYILMS